MSEFEEDCAADDKVCDIHCLTNHSLTKERPWVEHLTSPPKRGVGSLLSVSAFNHEKAPMSCLQ